MLTGKEASEHLGLELSLCYPWAVYDAKSREMPSEDQGCNWYQNASLGASSLSCVQVSLCWMAVLESLQVASCPCTMCKWGHAMGICAQWCLQHGM